MIKYRSLFLILAIFAACSPTRNIAPQAISYDGKTAKNVIFLVGDGMGIAQITAAMYMHSEKLALESFPVVGLHKNTASDDLITDSAAGATAFSIGRKSFNGAIGVDSDGKPQQTLLEEAELRGLATGLIATSTITHATPAAFVAHQKSRKLYEEIAADILKVDVDLMIGGGLKHFARRMKDERDLVKELQAKGYRVSDYFQEDFEDLDFNPGEPLVFFTADESPLPAYEGRDYLKTATEKGLHFLSQRSENGFFTLIEGSQIDWGGHANNSDYIISEMLDFDQAIAAALAFARSNGETLVVVTADHETGGLSIKKGSVRDSLVTAFTSQDHTLELIPVFAYGPGAELFSGVYENTGIYSRIRAAFGWK